MRERTLSEYRYFLAIACVFLTACGGGSSGDGNLLADDSQNSQQEVQQVGANDCAESLTGVVYVSIPTLMQNFSGDCDYFVRGNINVSSDLTIEAGTTIIMGKDASITVNRGRIIAVGSSDNRITIRGEVPLSGYWRGIFIIQARPSRIEHVDIMDGGQEPFSGRGAALDIGSAAISLIDVSISNSFTYGLNLGAGTRLTNFSNNRFFGNQLSGLSVYPLLIPELDTQSDYSGSNDPNEEPVVALDFYVGSLGQVTWPALNAPYADSRIQISGGEELTLSPGAQIAINDNDSYSGMHVSGTLIAKGSSDDPIVFSAAPGRTSWSQLSVATSEANVDFDHVVFKEADKGIVLEGSPRISISNTRFEAIDGYVINCEPLFGGQPMPVITIGENVSIPDTSDGLLNPNCPQ